MSDDTDGVTQAFAAARHAAFTLVVDCPVRLKIGSDSSRAIFVDDGTTVEFTQSGKLTVDNVFVPAFVIVNSHDITLTNWKVEYDAGLPVIPTSFPLGVEGAGAFNSFRITRWLTANRGIHFDSSSGYTTSLWTGSTNMCAIFFFAGDVSHVAVTGMQVSVPAAAGGDRFVPVVFSLNPDFRSNQTVSAKTPYTVQYFAVPHDLTFSNISLDGTYMGWVGSAQDSVFENIHSRRYGDLQDAKGENVGGVGKWFAPPHLFYLSYSTAVDPALYNKGIQIRNVLDEGVRVGTARDTNGKERLSGNALSLKIGCVDCSVDQYKSARPDGFLDVLSSDRLTISNVEASYNSGFLNNLYPGWRFPQPPYTRVKFENISLTDSAESTVRAPLGDTGLATDQGTVFRNINVRMNRWTGAGALPLPKILGQGSELSLDYSIRKDASRIMRSQKGSLQVTLQATPADLRAGADISLAWTTKDAAACSGSGAWGGPLPTEGASLVKMSAVGRFDFILECNSGDTVLKTILPVTVSEP
jgi:hypothetical protein